MPIFKLIKVIRVASRFLSIGHRDEQIERKVDDMKLEVKPKSKLVNFNDFKRT